MPYKNMTEKRKYGTQKTTTEEGKKEYQREYMRDYRKHKKLKLQNERLDSQLTKIALFLALRMRCP